MPHLMRVQFDSINRWRLIVVHNLSLHCLLRGQDLSLIYLSEFVEIDTFIVGFPLSETLRSKSSLEMLSPVLN